MAAVSKRVSMARAIASANASTPGVVDEEAGLAGHDGLERAAAAERDHRTAARLRLERHDAEVFFAGQQGHRRAPVERRESRRPAGGRETRTCAPDAAASRSSAARSGPSPAIFSGTPASAAGVNRDIDTFVGDECRHDQREPLGWGRIGMEKIGVDGRIHHSRLAIIVSADPARNIMRDSDIAVRAVGRVAIPSRQPRHHRPHQPRCRAGPSRSRAEVGVELIPGVAHRRQAIAEMGHAPGTHDRLRAAVADADHEIEAVEGELLDRRREERQVVAIAAA